MIAVLSDIHGNIHALDAVLADLPKEVNDILILGDMIGGLATNCEVLDRLMNLTTPMTAILGNWEERFLADRKSQIPEWRNNAMFAPLPWTSDSLQAHHWAFLEQLSSTLSFAQIIKGAFLFHAKPDDSNNGILTIEDAKQAANSRNEKWLLCGHTHQAKLFRVGEQRVVTVGSVGLSMDGIGGVACYVLIDEDKVTFKHVSYNINATIADLENSTLPSCAPGFSRANTLAIIYGENYVAPLTDFVQTYDGTWKEAEQAWLKSMEGR